MIKLFRKGGIEKLKNAKWGRGGYRGINQPID